MKGRESQKSLSKRGVSATGKTAEAGDRIARSDEGLAVSVAPNGRAFIFHPVAEMFPLIEGDDFKALVADVNEFGQRERGLVEKRSDGTLAIIDGRNRYRASQQLGREFLYDVWDGKGSLVARSCSLNLRRRHLTTSQRAASAVIVADQLAIEAKQRMIDGGKLKGLAKTPNASARRNSRDEAAVMCGVSSRYVGEAKDVRKKFPDLFQELLAGKINISQARSRAARRSRAAETAREVRAVPLPPKDCRVIVGDCITEMRRLDEGSARVVFADPPYNNGWKYDSDRTKDKVLPETYLDWCREWMREAARLLADDGSMFVLIDGNYSDHFGVILREIKLHRRNTIVWHEHFPSHTSKNFSSAARFVHYFTKSPDRFIWNGEAVAETSRREELGDARAAGGGLKVPDNVWRFNRVVGNAGDRVKFDDAPPQIPEALVERCIRVASNPGDLVVDPFNGNGTTGRAALVNGRRYVGIERSPLYARQSELWIKKALAGKAAG